MDRFRALQVFVAVTDCNGFASAARKLHMSPAAVTRMIAALEDQIGTLLFARTTRHVRLTETGALFAAEARNILADLTEAEARASGATQALRGKVRLTAPILFGRSHVAAAVFDFMRKNKHVTVDLLLLNQITNLMDEDIDVGIRIGELIESSLIAIRVGSVRRVLCASPDYIARCGRPRTLGDIERHDGIDLTSASDRQWTFQHNGREKTVRPNIVLRANSPDIVIDAALKGFGVARFMTYQVWDKIESRQLLPLLPRSETPSQLVHIVYPSQRHLPKRVRALIDHLKTFLRGHGR
jgi:DNA-binding transcriptional LysR family regulator